MSRLSKSLPNPVTYTQMASPGNELPGWLWEGYLAFESITLLTSRWKTGKTTLLSALLSRLGTGGTLAGSPAVAAPALVVSEESESLWLDRGRRTPFGPDVRWVCRPFIAKPTRSEWLALVVHLAKMTARKPTLIVFDPLAMVLPGFDENNAGTMIDALAPLRQFASAGHAVLLLHHPRKGRTLEPRGSGAVTGLVDILIEMDGSPNEEKHPNRRWLRARGRIDGVIRERLIELNAEQTDYLAIDAAAEDLTDGWPVIEWILSDATSKCTRQQILNGWPEMREKPHPASLWKWLESASSDGRVERDGEGRPHKPFRYWLRSREKHFRPDLPPLPPLEPVGDWAEVPAGEIKFAEEVLERGSKGRRRK